MKQIGIVRKVDFLGRIVIPKEMRKVLAIETDDPVEITAEGDCIVIKKYQPSCIFCGGRDTVTEFKGKLVCADCIRSLTESV